MKYKFKDILNQSLYDMSRVLFIFGKYVIFSNMICDTIKQGIIDTNPSNTYINNDLAMEFGVDISEDSAVINSVDLNSFFDVIGVQSINGKWFCRVDLSLITKQQKDKLYNYLRNPSDNGILIITSTDWRIYKDFLKNKTISISKYVNLIQVDYPDRNTLKAIVKQMFSVNNLKIDNDAIDLFIMKLSTAYDDYDTTIENIVEMHKSDDVITKTILKDYLKNVENYVIDDYIAELMKPLSSDKTNNKKVLRMMTILEEEIGPKNLVYQLLRRIDEYIEFRLLINKGYIPVGIHYFYKDVIETLPNKEKYENMPEWKFRKTVVLSSQTSLKDWEYMKIILNRAIENVRISDDEMDNRCRKALYELSTRSVLTPSRLDNILTLDNILMEPINKINRIMYNEDNKIEDW